MSLPCCSNLLFQINLQRQSPFAATLTNASRSRLACVHTAFRRKGQIVQNSGSRSIFIEDSLRKCRELILPVTLQVVGLLSGAALILHPTALAAEKVGDFQASGLIFKDTVETIAIEDPDVQGVTIYISDFRRSITDKLAKSFFSEPSQASVTCAQTGPVKVADMAKIRGQNGQEVFSERKSLSFFQNKTLRVRRLFDEDRGTLLYVAYSTRLTSDSNSEGPSRYRTSICALPLHLASAPEVLEVPQN
eukprot:jgi/Botrbrau1/7904/Bobra.9_2s0077.1